MTILNTMMKFYDNVLNGGVAIKYWRKTSGKNVVYILNPRDDIISIILPILILEKNSFSIHKNKVVITNCFTLLRKKVLHQIKGC